MFVIFKLIEAGARGREQNDVTGLRRVRGDFDRTLVGSGTFDGDAAVNLLFDLVRSGSDEERQDRFFAEWCLENGIVTAFVLATENDQDAGGKCVERFERGV